MIDPRAVGGPTTRARTASAAWLRSVSASGAMLMRRRARRDVALLTAFTGTVVFAILLAVIGPAHLTRTVDAGAREAVAAAGASADLVLELPVATPLGTGEPSVPVTGIGSVADDTRDRLPPALDATYATSTIGVRGPRLVVDSDLVQPALANPKLRLRLALAMLSPENTTALEVREGVLPVEVAPDAPIQLAISAETASTTSLAVGSTLQLPGIDPRSGTAVPLPATVVGIVDERRVGPELLSPWRDLREVFEPRVLIDGGAAAVGLTALIPPGAVDRAIRSRGIAYLGIIRLSFDPAAFTGDLLDQAVQESRLLTINSTLLVDSFQYRAEVSSGLSDAVSGFPGEARATLAELSIIIAGVTGAAAMVLLLVSRLIVARRLDDVLLERARGASLLAIGLRALAGSVVAVGIAVLIAFGIARLTGIGPPDDTAPLLIVLAVALIAGAVQTITAVRGRATASIVGVNRRDAIRKRRRRRVARLAAEAGVLVVAAAALVALLDRGLLQTGSDGIDPLIAVAPLLFAAAVTVLVLRLSPWPVRAVARATARGRGVAGPVISSRLLRGLAPLPLIALTIAIALVVGTGLIGQTVRDGQVAASWQRIGADVRTQGRIDADAVTRVAAADGVSAVSAVRVEPGLQLELGTSASGVTLVAVDEGYPGLVAGLPDISGVPANADADLFALLREDVADDAPLPLLVDEAIAERLISDDVSVEIGNIDVQLRVVGTVQSGPVGYLENRLVYVDLAALSARLSPPRAADSLLVNGPGAAAAVEQLDPAPSEVLTRSQWLAERRDLALVDGVQQAIVVGAAVLALLALLAIVCSALAGSPERARYLGLLRTLGVRRRFGILLAVIDQVPLMLAALVGGVLAGLGIALLLAPALGLRFLTGGVFTPQPSIPPLFLGVVLVGVVVVFAIGTLIEVLLRRRDRVSDTVRVGETV